MSGRRLKRIRFVWMTILLAFVLLACSGNKVDGTYHSKTGLVTVELKAGKAFVTMLGMTTEGTYEVKTDQIILHGKDIGDIEFRRNGDGSLAGPLLFGELEKKPSS